MATQEISDYVNGLSSATLVGTEELYLDTDEKASINEVGEFLNGKIWKAQITQTGTDAAVLNVLVNTLGITAVPTYFSTGIHRISGFDSKLTGNVAIEGLAITTGMIPVLKATTSSILDIATYNLSLVLTNGLLVDPLIQIITVTKYD